MIYMSLNRFCMIWVGEQLPDCLTRDVRSLSWSVMMKWPPTPPPPPQKNKKSWKKKFVLKCILGHFQCFERFLFLQGRSHILFSGKYTYRGLTWYSYFWSTLKTFLLYFSGPSNHHRHCILAIFWGHSKWICKGSWHNYDFNGLLEFSPQTGLV